LQKSPRRFRPSKKIALVLAVLILLGGGSAAAYFGYFVPNKPPNVWRTALTNTGKGYDKLSQYATTKKDSKGLSTKGSFKFGGILASDGAFSGLSDNKNGQFSGSVSAAGLKINYEVRAINSTGNTPDIYFKINGVQGLGSLVGGYVDESEKATITKALNGLNGQWYFIDHTLFDQFSQGTNTDFQISSKDVNEILKAVGDASKQYLFTNDNTKMAIVVKQYVGKEKQDGNNVYHYKVGVNKDNLQAYNKALCNNLAKTKLFKLFSGDSSSGDVDLIKQCQDSTGLDKVNTSQTADAWVDLHTKLIHKIRFTQKNNSGNYVDISQNYKGGDEFPFSLAFHDQSSVDSGISSSGSKPETSSGLINMKLNTKTNTFTMDANFATTGSANAKGTFNLTVTPNNQTVKVNKPVGAKTIIELLNDLGLGDLTSAASSGSSIDEQRKNLVTKMSAEMESYAANNNGIYPFKAGTGCSINTKGCWRNFYNTLSGVDLNDPQTKTSILGSNASNYSPTAYSVSANNKLPASGLAIVVYGAKCSGQKLAVSGAVNISSRNYAIIIGLSSPNSWYCVDNS
jgi:hypothetical protein